MLGEIGAYGVNFHDNDLVPIDASPRSVIGSWLSFAAPAKSTTLSCRWRPLIFFTIAVFRDGAFTANDKSVRAYALQKTMRAMDLGAEFGAKIFVLWGGREGVETDACRRP